MHGEAAAPGAGTVLNALATGVGSAFAIDAETRATVELDRSGTVDGEIVGAPGADTRLVETCVELVLASFADEEGLGGRVRTESDVPMAAGLKSSSAAANATALATLEALDVTVVEDGTEESRSGSRHDTYEGADGVGTDEETDPDAVTRLDACRIGVRAAREVGVTVTGAFDDASASMLGGVTVTDNRADELLSRDVVDWDVAVWTPPERAYSADADVERCERVASMAELVAELALDGRYAEAMTVNGLAFSAALDFPTDPTIEAMPHAAGVSLSGTGPSVVAVASDDDRGREALDRVADLWGERDGTVRRTHSRADGARPL